MRSTVLESTTLPGPQPLHVSRAALGGCPLGGHGWGAASEDEAVTAVRSALDHGVDLFDTADCYGLGHSEELLSHALGAERHHVTIVSKAGVRWDGSGRTRRDASPDYLRQAIEGSLRRLRLDRIPLYLLHWPDGITPIADTIGALGELVVAGKIGAIGVSNLSLAELRVAASVAPIAMLQLRASLIHREHTPVALAARELGISVWAWGALGEGLLTGKYGPGAHFGGDDRRSRYPEFQGQAFARNLELARVVVDVATELGRTPAQVALRWLLDGGVMAGVLFGAKRPAQVEDDVGCLGWQLPPELHARLLAAAERAAVAVEVA